MTAARRVLAIDGDGTRIFLTLRILRRIEAVLRERTGNPDLTLGHWFDLIGGTNSGGLVAALLVKGESVEDIERRLHQHGPTIFARPSASRWLFANGLRALMSNAHPGRAQPRTKIDRLLREWFRSEDGQDLKLADISDMADCHLYLGLYNLSTDSPWPLSSNPDAMFNRDPVASNLHMKLWSLVRGSLAAPSRFSPVRISVMGRELVACDFADGSSGGPSNVTLDLVMMATLDAYRLRWAATAEDLLVVSAGSGIAETLPGPLKRRRRPTPERLNGRDQLAMMLRQYNVHEDLLCRILGEVRWAAPEINLELADVQDESAVGGGRSFSYVRYNDLLTDEAIRRLDVGHAYGDDVRHRYKLSVVDDLCELGDSIAGQVDSDHFTGF